MVGDCDGGVSDSGVGVEPSISGPSSSLASSLILQVVAVFVAVVVAAVAVQFCCTLAWYS
jgi:hypothetical protein